MEAPLLSPLLFLLDSSFSFITLAYCVYVYAWKSEDNLGYQSLPSTLSETVSLFCCLLLYMS